VSDLHALEFDGSCRLHFTLKEYILKSWRYIVAIIISSHKSNGGGDVAIYSNGIFNSSRSVKKKEHHVIAFVPGH
jgi:hypothetical protein